MSAFPSTPKFKQSVTQFNQLSSEKLSMLLSQILVSIKSPSVPTFSREQELQLQSLLNVTDDVVIALVEFIRFIYEVAAHNNWKSQIFGQQLLESGFSEERAVQIVQAWTSESAAVISSLKNTPFFGSNILLDSSYRVELGMGPEGDGISKEIGATLTLSFAENSKNLSIGFSKEGLASFFEKLDKIEQQIDSLG